MSLDEDLKEAFTRHAEDVRPYAASWGTVERKVRRAHYRRATAVSVFAVALIVAAAVAIPKLRSTPRGFTSTGSPTPSSSTTETFAPAPTEELHIGARE